jgi:hypothetical protein
MLLKYTMGLLASWALSNDSSYFLLGTAVADLIHKAVAANKVSVGSARNVGIAGVNSHNAIRLRTSYSSDLERVICIGIGVIVQNSENHRIVLIRGGGIVKRATGVALVHHR